MNGEVNSRGACGLVPPTEDCPLWTGEVADDLCAACFYVDYLYDLEALIDEDSCGLEDDYPGSVGCEDRQKPTYQERGLWGGDPIWEVEAYG